MKQQLELAVFALQRSGHHAVLAFIKNMINKKYNKLLVMNWINQATPQLDPFNTKTGQTGDPAKYKPAQRGIPRDVLVYNFEDAGLYFMKSMSMFSEVFNGKSGKRINIIIIRDLYNMLASRMERTRVKGKPFSHPYRIVVGLWLEQAEAVIKTKYIGTPVMCINYNKWFSRKHYRKMLAASLDLPYSEETLSKVSHAGEGSSFTGLHGSGRSLKVLDRWQSYKADPEFIEAVDHHIVRVCSDKIFGWHLAKDPKGILKMVPYKKARKVHKLRKIKE